MTVFEKTYHHSNIILTEGAIVCVHPTNLKHNIPRNINHSQLSRFKGILANASALSPEELNNCGLLHQDDFESMISEITLLVKEFQLKINRWLLWNQSIVY